MPMFYVKLFIKKVNVHINVWIFLEFIRLKAFELLLYKLSFRFSK